MQLEMRISYHFGILVYSNAAVKRFYFVLAIYSGVFCLNMLVGMHQQGIFRVSGSQTEIIEFKAAFERGEDPLIDVHEARDINSTAGLFKLYFRELGEPPFPNSLFLSLIECARDSEFLFTIILVPIRTCVTLRSFAVSSSFSVKQQSKPNYCFFCPSCTLQ